MNITHKYTKMDVRRREGRKVLKLEAEVFQQQQQERRDRQPHAGGNVRGE